ncbi:MAG: PAS domain S-box protein [Deltaproteobacteria bacterium]|nr:PAS domain S-box protein [Deltaproteobacteria bacterium]
MNIETFQSLINNAALLLALVVVYDSFRLGTQLHEKAREIFLGISVGLIGLAVMTNPMQFVPGIIFDTRSILLSLSGVFFGLVPTSIAVLMTILFRVFQGGGGVLMGIAVILTSAVLGLLWRRLLEQKKVSPRWPDFYFFGIVVHVAMLLWMLALPRPHAWDVISRIGPVVMLIYPVATVFLGIFLSHHRERQRIQSLIQKNERRFRKMVEQGWDILGLLNGNMGFHPASDSVAAVLGYTLDEMDGDRLSRLVHQEDAVALAETFGEVLSQKNSARKIDFRLLHQKGWWVWIEAVLTNLVDDPDIGAVVFNGRDISARKALEESLRENETKLRKAQAIGRMGSWEFDLNTGMVAASDEARRIYGLASREWTIAEVKNIPLPEYRAMLEQAMADLLEGRQPYNVSFRIRRPGDGELLDIHSQAEFDSERHVMVGTIRDITEQRRAEDALRERETMLASILAASPVGIGVVKDRKFTWLSRTFCDMHGYGEEELIGKEASCVYENKAEFERAGKVLYEGLINQGVGETETRCRCRDGRVMDTLVKAAPLDPIDPEAGITFTTLDITQQKSTEERLRASEETYRSLFNATTAAVSIQDIEDFSFVDANQAFLDNYGYSIDEAKNLKPNQFCSPDETHRCKLCEENRERLLRGETVQVEVKDRRKDGTSVWMDKTIRKVNINGIDRIMTLAQDTTEKKMMNQIMIQNEKIMALGGLAAGMAHEINNPLGIISQGVQNVMRRTLEPIPANLKAAEESHLAFENLQLYLKKRNVVRSLEAVQEAALRAAGIVENMLEFSRSNENTPLPNDVNQIIEKAIALACIDYDLKKKYDFRNIRIITEFGKLPKVPCLDSEMEQVFLNLLRNSAQSLWAAERQDPVIRIRTRKEKDQAIMEIEDNGAGITAEHKARIFEPFFTTKKPGEGTGLGLSVSFHIVVQRHHGQMTLESEPGAWTRFRIELPYVQEFS